eukprot:CAMPEP_0168501294 /NCGR_PEP_ID=MMETSP0228-20121227/74727_1 /TAXON_ID=133427 /ORGANISM="Protoceratium reticulatum, Strain CCCM 535 (=CCMP 1889)" /LENGTH=37 /DNA_ID= /DNA_START= /DNA_END= /DNA_ORIENTATION=
MLDRRCMQPAHQKGQRQQLAANCLRDGAAINVKSRQA